MSNRSAAPSNPFRQPKAVFAVALACVVSFMGIGLVDPILPSLATKLHATPIQVELLFTSYLVITAAAIAASIGVLATGHALLGRAEEAQRLEPVHRLLPEPLDSEAELLLEETA